MFEMAGMAGGGEAAAGGESVAVATPYMQSSSWLNDWIGGGMSSLISGGISNMFAKSNAKTAFKRQVQLFNMQKKANEEFYAKRYQTTMADMRAAGLNPILAASGGFNVGNGPSVGLPQAAQAASFPVPGIGSSAREFAETDKAQAETEVELVRRENVVRDSLLKMANEQKAIQEGLESRARTGLATAQEAQAVEATWKLEAEIQEIAVRMQKMNVEISQIAARRDLEVAETYNVEESLGLIKQEKELMSNKVQALMYELSQLERTSDVYKGPAGAVISHVREIMHAIGILPLVAGALGGRYIGRGSKVSPGQRGIMD